MLLYDRRIRPPAHMKNLRLRMNRDDPDVERPEQQKQQKQNQAFDNIRHNSMAAPSRNTDIFDSGKFHRKICCEHVMDNFGIAPAFSRRLDEITSLSSSSDRWLRGKEKIDVASALGVFHGDNVSAATSATSRATSPVTSSRPVSSRQRPVSAYTNASHQMYDTADQFYPDALPPPPPPPTNRPRSCNINNEHLRRGAFTPQQFGSVFVNDDEDADGAASGGEEEEDRFEAVVQLHKQRQQREEQLIRIKEKQQQQRPRSSPAAMAMTITGGGSNPHASTGGASRGVIPSLQFSEDFCKATGVVDAHSPLVDVASRFSILHRSKAPSAITEEIMQRRRETSMITVPTRMIRGSGAERRPLSAASADSASSSFPSLGRGNNRNNGGGMFAENQAIAIASSAVGAVRLRKAGSGSSAHVAAPCLTKSMIFMHAAATMRAGRGGGACGGRGSRPASAPSDTSADRFLRAGHVEDRDDDDHDDERDNNSVEEDDEPLLQTRSEHLGYDVVLSALQVQSAKYNYNLTVQSHLDDEKKRPMRVGKRYTRMAASVDGVSRNRHRSSSRSQSPHANNCNDNEDDYPERCDRFAVMPSLCDLRPDIILVPSECVLEGTKIPLSYETKIAAAMKRMCEMRTKKQTENSGSEADKNNSSRPGTPVVMMAAAARGTDARLLTGSPRRTSPASHSFDIKHRNLQEHQQPRRRQFRPRPPPSSSSQPAVNQLQVLDNVDSRPSSTKIPAPPKQQPAVAAAVAAAAVSTPTSPLAGSVSSATLQRSVAGVSTASDKLGSTTLLLSLSSVAPSSALASTAKNTWLKDGASLSTSRIYNRKKEAVFIRQSGSGVGGSGGAATASTTTTQAPAGGKKNDNDDDDPNSAATRNQRTGAAATVTSARGAAIDVIPEHRKGTERINARRQHYLNANSPPRLVSVNQKQQTQQEELLKLRLFALVGTPAATQRPQSAIDTLPRSARR